MTTFPRACPSSRYRMASGTSASGYVLSMIGVIFPDSMSSLRTSMSSWFSLLTNVPSFWLTNGDSIIARSWRSVPPSHRPPPSPPTMMRVPGGEGPPKACQRRVSADVEDQVVALIAFGEVLACVVDDVIRTDGSDHLHLRGAAHAGDVCAERLGDLHGVGTHSSRRTNDKHFLPRAHLSMVTQGLQGGRAHDGYHSRLLKGEVRWLGGELVLPSTHVLGVGALSDT